jgi:heptosyltransferase I
MVEKKAIRVLIVKMSSMGDIIHTLPALTDAQKAIPNISFDWVIEKSFAEIPGWHKAVKKIIPIQLRSWRKNLFTLPINLWRFRRGLRNQKYDLVIDIQGLLKSGLIAGFAKGVHCGYDYKSARESLAAIFYQRRFAVTKNQHAITRNRKLFAQALGYVMPNSKPDYGIKENFKKAAPQNYLVFLHSTARAEKLWSENNWVELAKLAQRWQIKLPWGNADEHARAIRMSELAGNFEVLPKVTLTELAEILLAAKAVVAVDTGLGHLCAALDVPTLSLYGVTDPKLIGTFGANQMHLVDISVNAVWHSLQQFVQSH